MATGRGFKDKTTGEKRYETQWHSIKAWGPIAESLGKYVKKGQNLYIEGEIQYSEFEAKDGSGKRYSTSIMAQEFKFIPNATKDADTSAGPEEAATKSVQDFKTAPAAATAPAPVAQTVSASSADVMGDGDDLPF